MVGAEGSPAALAHLRALAMHRSMPTCWSCADAIGALLRRLERLAKRQGRMSASRNTLRPLGFVQQIADLMVACDVLVTKTGGVTLAEAFCCGLPVLAFDPLPGQEEGNARYVVGRGAAVLARSPSHLVGRQRVAPVARAPRDAGRARAAAGEPERGS